MAGFFQNRLSKEYTKDSYKGSSAGARRTGFWRSRGSRISEGFRANRKKMMERRRKFQYGK